MTDIETSMQHLVDHLVDAVPGVTGALVSSIDGFVLASRLPTRPDLDPAAVAAMSAAMLGLANRLVELTGDTPATSSHQRSNDGQAVVFAVAHVAVLTVLADPSADPDQLHAVGHEVTNGLVRVFRGDGQPL
jgi:predicted regulator of Ras-like GTPase activity (Roadblock/LC7/MglB family)